MTDAFYQFDKDGTGKINKAELKEMLEFQMGVALDDVRCCCSARSLLAGLSMQGRRYIC